MSGLELCLASGLCHVVKRPLTKSAVERITRLAHSEGTMRVRIQSGFRRYDFGAFILSANLLRKCIQNICYTSSIHSHIWFKISTFHSHNLSKSIYVRIQFVIRIYIIKSLINFFWFDFGCLNQKLDELSTTHSIIRSIILIW